LLIIETSDQNISDFGVTVWGTGDTFVTWAETSLEQKYRRITACNCCIRIAGAARTACAPLLSEPTNREESLNKAASIIFAKDSFVARAEAVSVANYLERNFITADAIVL